ncbi:MAG: hypothetical protein IT204_17175 [Fimbriimonadaceae bacterium]|nr:hypothetical protein [Fimbriimonadaceae bacterium]
MLTPAERYAGIYPLFRGEAALGPDEAILARAPMRWMWTGWRDVARGGGGDCSNAAVTAYAFATIQRGADPHLVRLVATDVGIDLRLRREDILRPPDPREPHALLRAMIHAANPPLGLELACTAKGIPAATGLGTSAALAVTLVRVLAEAAGRSLSPSELVYASRLPETHLLGLSCGFQDQGAAVQGGLGNYRTAFDGAAEEVELLPLAAPEDLIDTLDAGLIVVDFGKPHSSHVAHLGVFERLQEGHPDSVRAFELLAAAETAYQAALAAGDFDAFAAAQNLTWEAQGLLHPEMVLPIMRDVVDMSRGLGVRAANVNGAGMGGTVTLLAEPDAVGRVIRALQAVQGVQLLQVGIERRGVKCWRRRRQG